MTKTVTCSIPKAQHEFLKRRCMSPSRLLQRAISEEMELTVKEGAQSD